MSTGVERLGDPAAEALPHLIPDNRHERAAWWALPSVVAELSAPGRRHWSLTVIAIASILLAFGVMRIAQWSRPPTDAVGPSYVNPMLTALPFRAIVDLVPAVGQRAADIVPRVRDEAAELPPTLIQPTRPPAVRLPPRVNLADTIAPPAAGSIDTVRTRAMTPPEGSGVPTPDPPPLHIVEPAVVVPPSLEPPRRENAPPAVDRSANDGIAAALKHLQLAYDRRDAALVKAVWPTVNERALARAFDGLRSQSLTFEGCRLNVSGEAGEVECRGVTTYVPKVGSQDPRTESRQWTFRVWKNPEGWLIARADTR